MGWEDQERDELGRFGSGSGSAADADVAHEERVAQFNKELGEAHYGEFDLMPPFPRASAKEQAAAFKKDADRANADREWRMTDKEVELSELKAGQEAVDPQIVMQYVVNAVEPDEETDALVPVDDDPILVIKSPSGGYVIWNGHHRASAAMALGLKKIKTKVLS